MDGGCEALLRPDREHAVQPASGTLAADQPVPETARAAPAEDAPATAPGVYCVLGMHRSGTSLVAGLLHAAGVRMGMHLLEPAPDNPRGFFEDVDFVRFHEACLARRGWSYANAPQARIEFTGAERTEALRLIEARSRQASWGWKDPRTCLFVDAWYDLLPECRFLIVYRHPLAVMASLLRRGERTVVADLCAGLEMWATYTRGILEFLDRRRPAATVVETEAIFQQPERFCERVRPLGIALAPRTLEAHAHAGEFAVLAGLEELHPLVGALAPQVLDLHARMTDRLDLRSVGAPSLAAELRDALRQLCAIGGRAGVPALTGQNLLLAGLGLLDASLAGRVAARQAEVLRANEALHQVEMQAFMDKEALRRQVLDEQRAARTNYERALAAEAAADRNYQHAQAAEAAARENLQRAESAEQASRANYERALSAEAAARANYERALSAEATARENYERALSAEAASRENYERAVAAETALADTRQRLEAAERDGRLHRERAVAAEALAGSLRLQLEELAAQLAQAAKRTQEVEAELHGLRGVVAGQEAALRRLEAERNYYRRRWPPYAARRVVQKLWDWGRRQAYRRRHRRALVGFGHQASLCVMWTGLPRPEACAAVGACLSRQTRQMQRLVIPGACELRRGAGPAPEPTVFNWWGPDLRRLLASTDYVLLLHPEYYGPGPLWNPLALEMLVAALASDERLAAIALRGSSDGPRIGTPNHLHETDAATVWQWPETTLAGMFRTEALCEAFPPANPGESREIRPALVELMRRGRRVLVAPQSFPLGAEQAVAAAGQIGARLPARPRQAIRALFVTQWLECGGADKGAIDLLRRVDPQVVDFSLLTTVASAHPWEERLRGFVREIVHEGAWLPLPPEKRFPSFLVEYVRRRQIGLVHIMHSFLGYDALPELKRELPGVRVLDQCHILEPPDNMQGGHPAYSSRRYKQYLDRRTVTSHWLKRYLMTEHGIPESRISVIYTCVDDEHEYNPDRVPRGRFRRSIRVPEGARLVLFIGRLHWQKRPWLFVRIAEQVLRRARDLDTYFVMVGPGPERPRIEALRAALPDPRRLILVGEVSDSAPVYRDADLLLMPSQHEGLAFVSFEAMAMGLPQIYTDVNGQSELITPETGVLIPPQDEQTCVEAGTQAVLELLRDEPRRQRMAQAGRQRIREHFNIRVMVRAYEQLYRRLMEEPGTRVSPAAPEHVTRS